MENAFNKIDEYLSFFDKFLLNLGGNVDNSVILKAMMNTVSSLILRERFQEAREILVEGLKTYPNNVRVMELYAIACDGVGEHEEAIDVFTQLIALEPKNPDHLNNISIAFAACGKKSESVAFAIKTVELDSNPLYFNNLGLQFRNAGMINEAINAFEKSLKKKPDPYFMVNLATAYADTLDYAKAIDYCETAIALKPKLSGAHVNLAYYYHLVGRHKEAWEQYEHRISHFKQIRDFLKNFDDNKRWNGTDSLNGKRILVLCEQGLGDTIHFIRYVSVLKKLGCHVMVFGPLQLASLCETCEGVDEYICKELSSYLDYDYYTLILSLPYLLKCDIPNSPYISVPKVPRDSKKFRIGVCWKGSKLHALDSFRSVNPALFFELGQIPGVELLSLQKDGTTAELQSAKADNLMEMVKDFKDTAEIITTLDLVVSVDTAVLHLAGAMGCKTWGLIPYRCDWRWGTCERRTEWYSSVLLYRQQQVGIWSDVFEKVNRDVNDQVFWEKSN